VPIVTGAVLYDLGVGDANAFPGDETGYVAASRAKRGAVAEGSVGAGTGATVAKLLGPDRCLKGGIGTASAVGPGGLVVGALVATNAVGSVFDPETGALVAGPRNPDGTMASLPDSLEQRRAAMEALLENTTLMCVATNANLEHHQVQRLAMQAHDGFARVVSPAHSFSDGDVAFAVSMGGVDLGADTPMLAGMLVARAVEQALLRSVRLARGVKGVPSAAEFGASR